MYCDIATIYLYIIYWLASSILYWSLMGCLLYFLFHVLTFCLAFIQHSSAQTDLLCNNTPCIHRRHSGLCEQYVLSRGLSGSVLDFLFTVRPILRVTGLGIGFPVRTPLLVHCDKKPSRTSLNHLSNGVPRAR